MQVVQPNPTMWKPRPFEVFEQARLLQVILDHMDPGAKLVLTQGFTASPRSRALRASSPAPTSTAGFDVLVHEVIAAITTAPSRIS